MKRSHLTALLLILPSLYACGETKEQSIAQCKIEAMKAGLAYVPGWEMVKLCMEIKGYESDLTLPSNVCPLNDPYYSARCYRSTSTLGRLSEKLQ